MHMCLEVLCFVEFLSQMLLFSMTPDKTVWTATKKQKNNNNMISANVLLQDK